MNDTNKFDKDFSNENSTFLLSPSTRPTSANIQNTNQRDGEANSSFMSTTSGIKANASSLLLSQPYSQVSTPINITPRSPSSSWDLSTSSNLNVPSTVPNVKHITAASVASGVFNMAEGLPNQKNYSFSNTEPFNQPLKSISRNI